MFDNAQTRVGDACTVLIYVRRGKRSLLWRPTRRAAGIGLFLLTIAVTSCHVYMLQSPDLFAAIPSWALSLRLPIQLALLALIVWCTRPDRRDSDSLSYYRAIKPSRFSP